ncbi:nucleoid protein H-NS [Pasteurella testudinis DSM 23072]|uniref:DNA-binding protein n=1 Tax=Pasteurella testudinis DSM 23072 TaxID=1122938 RepID=A0A1W1UN04_9PAST|nr:H-NS family nucleoid-associated regulatory protein [Pasteurella testudinis]SMB82476.1 nucleoid protein H-NS [Pasteurella testudinis DSM 23072]SUB52195.1 DNA-binding protein H-NS [Pasteurella testudinis]
MNELIKALSNLRKLRTLVKDLSLEQLEAISAKFTSVIIEKKEESLILKKQEEQRLQKITSFKEYLNNSGLSKEELASILLEDHTAKSKKRVVRPAKYHFTDENGKSKTWTGQGRTPKAIQTALNNGKSLSDFEI